MRKCLCLVYFVIICCYVFHLLLWVFVVMCFFCYYLFVAPTSRLCSPLLRPLKNKMRKKRKTHAPCDRVLPPLQQRRLAKLAAAVAAGPVRRLGLGGLRLCPTTTIVVRVFSPPLELQKSVLLQTSMMLGLPRLGLGGLRLCSTTIAVRTHFCFPHPPSLQSPQESCCCPPWATRGPKFLLPPGG